MKKVKFVCISHWSDSDENDIDCDIARDCQGCIHGLRPT